MTSPFANAILDPTAPLANASPEPSGSVFQPSNMYPTRENALAVSFCDFPYVKAWFSMVPDASSALGSKTTVYSLGVHCA